MYTEYKVGGANSFGENFQKPRQCTDGRTHTKKGPRRKQSGPPVFHWAGHNYNFKSKKIGFGLDQFYPPMSTAKNECMKINQLINY